MTEYKSVDLGGNTVHFFYRKCSKLPFNKVYSEQHRIGRELLSEGLHKLFNITFNEKLLGFNSHDKPYLINFPNTHFNISHSRSWVVVAISNVEIGVDIEELRSFDNSFIQRVYSPEELAMSKGINGKNEYFTRLWTLKESYFKCKGTGLEFPLTKTSFVLDDLNYPIKIKRNDYNFYQDKIDGNSIFSICVLSG